MNARIDASRRVASMPDKQCPEGPGGRDCPCCGQSPGKWRRIARRSVKRGDESKFRQSIRKYLSR